MKIRITRLCRAALVGAVSTIAIGAGSPVWASSHMDAPLITLDDAANTTDVYAFVAEDGGRKYLATALAVYPFQEPGIGPNTFRFDDAVRYEIHVAVGKDLKKGRATYSYRFEFKTRFENPNTILQAFLALPGPVGVEDGDFTNLNQTQTYKVTRVNHRTGKRVALGRGVVPPNNQGLVTPLYNTENGAGPAQEGVDDSRDLDAYTQAAIVELKNGHIAFAGQRDDGFYADIQAIFEGLAFRSGDDRFDSQGGFNLHTIALNIPVEEIGGDLQQVGVYATTSRRAISILTPRGDFDFGRWVQVGRQGNPLFCEGLVAVADKDLYNRTSPMHDAKLFSRYADSPELAVAINAVFQPEIPVQETGQSDLVGIYIPDLIRVDLSTSAARLAGGSADLAAPNDAGFSRLGIFGGDVLTSSLTGGDVPGGWPNGRRFGDDVVDIAITAVLSDLADPNAELTIADGIDNVNENDIGYNKVFPYAATPLSGRNHGHH